MQFEKHQNARARGVESADQPARLHNASTSLDWSSADSAAWAGSLRRPPSSSRSQRLHLTQETSQTSTAFIWGTLLELTRGMIGLLNKPRLLLFTSSWSLWKTPSATSTLGEKEETSWRIPEHRILPTISQYFYLKNNISTIGWPIRLCINLCSSLFLDN